MDASGNDVLRNEEPGQDEITAEFTTPENLDSIAVAVLVLDEAGAVRFANRAAERLLGRERETLAALLFGLPVLDGAKAEIDLIRPDGRPVAVEIRVLSGVWEGLAAQFLVLQHIAEQPHFAWEEAA